jgi:transposase InsO family protein
LIEATQHSTSIFYEWLQGVKERKKREVKLIPEDVAINTMSLMLERPHFGGQKGQQYMIYHKLGYIGHHTYQNLKKAMGRVLFQEVYRRNLLPKPTAYEHERPEAINEIWAEDFTKVKVIGCTFPIAVLIDVFSKEYLGYAVTETEDTDDLVRDPVEMALTENNQVGPKKFLLRDNGSQYACTKHGKLLTKHGIIEKIIPSCKPYYNGTIECGNKDVKAVFYNIIARYDLTEFKGVDLNHSDKKKKLLALVRLAVKETIEILNGEIPRHVLGGVTPDDVRMNCVDEKKKSNDEYRETEQVKEKVDSWSKSKWELAKDVLASKCFSNKQLLIKHYYFQKNPLTRIHKITSEVWTN